MSSPFEGIIVGDREVTKRYASIGPKMRFELKVGISRLTLKLQRNVKQGKLSGQVLGVRTGRGRRSIQQAVTNEGEQVVGIVSTAVSYMIGWENGWPGTANDQSLASAKSKFALGGGSADWFKNGSTKKRAFLAPGLQELYASGEIDRELDAAAKRSAI